MITEAYLVRFVMQGEPRKFITLDMTRAYERAAEWHGTVHRLVDGGVFSTDPGKMQIIDDSKTEHNSSNI